MIKDLRRFGILCKKRWDIFKYFFNLKKKYGFYSPEDEGQMMSEWDKSINLFDFRT